MVGTQCSPTYYMNVTGKVKESCTGSIWNVCRKWNYPHRIREYSTLCVEWQVNGRLTHSVNVPRYIDNVEPK